MLIPGNIIICCWSTECYTQAFRAVRKHSLTFLSCRWTYIGMISSWYTITFLPGSHPCACSHLWVQGSIWLKVQRNSTWLFRTGSCNIHLQECNCLWAGTGPGRLIPAGRNSCSCEGSQIWACCTEGKRRNGACQQPSELRGVQGRALPRCLLLHTPLCGPWGSLQRNWPEAVTNHVPGLLAFRGSTEFCLDCS